MRTLKTPALFCFIGAVPRTEWLPPEIEKDAKSFIRTGAALAKSPHWTARRQPFLLETSRPGCLRRRRRTVGFGKAGRLGRRGRGNGGPVRARILEGHVVWGVVPPSGCDHTHSDDVRRARKLLNQRTSPVALRLQTTPGSGGAPTTTAKLFYRIVIPTDFSDSSEEAWGLAQRVAGTLGSEVVLAHVFVPPPLYGDPPLSVDTTWQVYESSRKWVEEASRSGRTPPEHKASRCAR